MSHKAHVRVVVGNHMQLHGGSWSTQDGKENNSGGENRTNLLRCKNQDEGWLKSSYIKD